MIDKQKDRTITKKKDISLHDMWIRGAEMRFKVTQIWSNDTFENPMWPGKKRNHAIWIGVGGIMAEGSAKQPRKITKHFFLHLYEDITQTERGGKKVAFATTRFLLGFLAFTPSKCQDRSRDYRENNETTHTHKSRS